jgi:hypothetical protein
MNLVKIGVVIATFIEGFKWNWKLTFYNFRPVFIKFVKREVKDHVREWLWFSYKLAKCKPCLTKGCHWISIRTFQISYLKWATLVTKIYTQLWWAFESSVKIDPEKDGTFIRTSVKLRLMMCEVLRNCASPERHYKCVWTSPQRTQFANQLWSSVSFKELSLKIVLVLLVHFW